MKTVRALAALSLLLGGAVQAWPADVYLDLEQGREEFKKLAAIEWAEVEDPAIATVELLSSGELLFTGLKPGRTLALLYAEGKFAVWRLRVSDKGEKARSVLADPAPLTRACPGADIGERLAVKVADDACRTALATFLEGDRYSARDLEITFEIPALQAQLAAIQKQSKEAGLGALEVRYVGAGLVVKGALTPEAHRKALWILFRQSVGRVPLEDRTVRGD